MRSIVDTREKSSFCVFKVVISCGLQTRIIFWTKFRFYLNIDWAGNEYTSTVLLQTSNSIGIVYESVFPTNPFNVGKSVFILNIIEPRSNKTPFIGDGHPTFDDGNPYNQWVYPLLLHWWVVRELLGVDLLPSPYSNYCLPIPARWATTSYKRSYSP